jgi:hypothetical protein
MKETIRQIKDLATATENLYLLHLVKKLKKQIKKQSDKEKPKKQKVTTRPNTASTYSIFNKHEKKTKKMLL